MEVKFRKAIEKDYIHIDKFLAELHKLHYENRSDVYRECESLITKEEYLGLLKDDIHRIVVASVDGELAGYASGKIVNVKENIVQKKDKYLFIDEIYTDSKYRRMGIAKGLLEYLKEISKREECTEIQLNVWSFNEEAIKFYYSIGFKNRNIRLEYEI